MLFKRYGKNPIIIPDLTKDYESGCTYNPGAIVHNNKVYLVYRAEGEPQHISRLCLAVSDDGYNFQKYKDNPIIKPSIPEEKGGCEDPRITKISNTYYLTYTSYNGVHPVTSKTINTSLATSKDLIHWKRQGIIVKGLKSTAIFSKKINGKYIMFIGGKNIRIAKSSDIINWNVDKEPILDIRENKFDNRYVEVGPPPFVFDNKIVLLFNTADKNGVFRLSLAFLDKNNPNKVIYRADKPLMVPTEKYELKGNVNNVIFGEALVEFKGTYFFYYGAADKYVCVATVKKAELEKYLSSL